MLMTAKDIQSYELYGTDDRLGSVEDLLLEDHTHHIRWLVLDTGHWLPGLQVLLPPEQCTWQDADKKRFLAPWRSDQIEQAPNLDLDAPVSRQQERALIDYFGVPAYWGYAPDMWTDPATTAWPPGGRAQGGGWVPGSGLDPVKAQLDPDTVLTPDDRKVGNDPHLRSASHIHGYRIQASDEKIGHIKDLIVDLADWTIRYFIIDTRNWLPGGRKVILAPGWFQEFDYPNQVARVALTADAIRESPEFDPEALADCREYEQHLYRHYRQDPYWE